MVANVGLPVSFGCFIVIMKARPRRRGSSLSDSNHSRSKMHDVHGNGIHKTNRFGLAGRFKICRHNEPRLRLATLLYSGCDSVLCNVFSAIYIYRMPWETEPQFITALSRRSTRPLHQESRVIHHDIVRRNHLFGAQSSFSVSLRRDERSHQVHGAFCGVHDESSPAKGICTMASPQ